MLFLGSRASCDQETNFGIKKDEKIGKFYGDNEKKSKNPPKQSRMQNICGYFLDDDIADDKKQFRHTPGPIIWTSTTGFLPRGQPSRRGRGVGRIKQVNVLGRQKIGDKVGGSHVKNDSQEGGSGSLGDRSQHVSGGSAVASGGEIGPTEEAPEANQCSVQKTRAQAGIEDRNFGSSRCLLKRNREDYDDESDEEDKEEVTYGSSDIRYQESKKSKKIQKTAMSLFIYRPHTQDVKQFVNYIMKLHKAGITYQSLGLGVGVQLETVRLDFIFKENLWLNIFKNKIEGREKPENFNMDIKAVDELMMMINKDPVLTEKEMLSILMDDILRKNSFKGFSVEVIEEPDNTFKFVFDSMKSLNMFLANNVNSSKAFYGVIKESVNVSLQLLSMKKYGKTLYPLRVQLGDCNLNDVIKTYNCKHFTRPFSKDVQNDVKSLDFKSKKNLYTFITKEPVEFYIKTKSVL